MRGHDGVHLICAPNASLKDSGVKGLDIKKLAPAVEARARMSGVASVVTKPNLSLMPSLVRVSSNSMPVMLGMFQSDNTRSGGLPLMAVKAFAPSSHSEKSWPSKPASRKVF